MVECGIEFRELLRDMWSGRG